ncbi:phage portal protein, HK97 family [Mycobacteroides abscessus subsp. abscessus]|nr:phage portal protein, HK97 family [Mycobacteroides abscessus subsp. abscessus]SIN52504.1 phage portal protein, HK97 family [Mycobacteroides abscessus subsp. abscessus]SLI56995.1 phage portal protein, HK97 family [Mycobacteroides abscessus subsp. abscessus]
MGLASWLGFAPKPSQIPSMPARPTYELIPEGMSLDEYLTSIMHQPVEKLYREQPHLRTLVGFVSRNIAQLGIHVFERDAEDGRNRVRDSPLAELLRDPNDDMTQFELIEATVASRMLYDETYWYVGRDNNAPTGWVIRHIPTTWVIGTIGQTAFNVAKYKVAIPGTSGQWTEIDASDMIVFRGWNPVDPRSGVSPVHSLKAILAEQIHGQVFRDQMWKRGGRVGTYLTRPETAPNWTEAGPDGVSPRKRFIQQWKDSYAGDSATNAGGTPLLEDGMQLKAIAFNAKENQWAEGVKLSLETCAQVYFVNPTMVGILDNANYANVREFRKALYGDNLGPEIERTVQRINKKLVPKLADPRNVYCEFNLQTKLAGSFEEQGDMLQKAIGGPYMTRNEGRARLNMPRIDGGDELIVPLNVTANGDQNPAPAGNEPTDPNEGDKSNGRHINGHDLHVHF